MRFIFMTSAAACAVALSASLAFAGNLTPTTGESQLSGGAPTGGNQLRAVAVPSYRAGMAATPYEGRSAKRMRKHPAKKMMKEESSGAAPGGAKAGVGGMGAPASK